MNTQSTRAKGWLLFLVAAFGLTLGCNLFTPASTRRSEDAALLLMLASHSSIEAAAGDNIADARTPGLSVSFLGSLVETGARRNEARMLAEWYHALAEKLPEDDEVKQAYVAKADEYYEKAKALDQEREREERRRNRGFFRWFSQQVKSFGEGLGRVVGGAMGFAGAVVEYVIEEELPARIRAAIKGEWERIKAIAQGRIEMFWQHLADRYGDVVAGYLRDRVDPLFIHLRDRITGRSRRVSLRLTQTAEAREQATVTITPTPKILPPPTSSQPPARGQIITKTGNVVPVGLNPGLRATSNTISITYQDDGRAPVRGSGMYAAIYKWESCNKDLPSSVRWDLTGSFDPVTRRFSGTLQEYGQGQITYTDCSVGTVPENKDGEGGTWEAVLVDGVIKGSITLIQTGGIPLERVTFEAR